MRPRFPVKDYGEVQQDRDEQGTGSTAERYVLSKGQLLAAIE